MEHKSTEQEDCNLDVRNWRTEVIPGCCFIQFLASGTAIYGEVLQGSSEKGYFRTHSYSRLFLEGYEARTHELDFAMLLSREQFEEARRLGWPSRQGGVQSIFLLPPS